MNDTNTRPPFPAGCTIRNIRRGEGEPAPAFDLCPSCGWNALIHRTWYGGVSWWRAYRCMSCSWSQSGTC